MTAASRGSWEMPTCPLPLTKVPVLVYFHGGGFCIESASSPIYQNFLNRLISAANIVCVSVEYRRALEHPLPAAYEDYWAALKWFASHSDSAGLDEWLNAFADPKRTFQLAGDSAGANFTHCVALWFGTVEKLSGIVIEGAIMTGNDDPRINPWRRIQSSGSKVTGGWQCSWLSKTCCIITEWVVLGGVAAAEVVDSKGVGHVFNPGCDKAADKMKKMVDFINANKL